jgi:F-type H+-transporting ATPase subunit a
MNSLFNEILSPLNQFEVRDMLNLNILNYLNLSLTNIGLYLTIGGLFILTMNVLSSNYNKLISNN